MGKRASGGGAGKAVAMGIIQILIEIFRRHGKEILEWTAGKIRNAYRRYFTNRNILILGARQTGKTSLVNFLATGKPYQQGKGGKELPNPTSGAVVIGKKTKVTGDQYFKIPKDIGGDPMFRHLWGELIGEVQPQGIIYMIDGRLLESELREAVAELDTDVLAHFKDDRHSLIALHVFLNFADKWGKMPTEVRRRTQIVRDALSFDDDLNSSINGECICI